jgi:hypothetical protein
MFFNLEIAMKRLRILLVVVLALCDAALFASQSPRKPLYPSLDQPATPYFQFNPRPSAPAFDDEEEEELTPEENAKIKKILAEQRNKRLAENRARQAAARKTSSRPESRSNEDYWADLLEKAASSEVGQRITKAVAQRAAEAILGKEEQPQKEVEQPGMMTGGWGYVKGISPAKQAMPSGQSPVAPAGVLQQPAEYGETATTGWGGSVKGLASKAWQKVPSIPGFRTEAAYALTQEEKQMVNAWTWEKTESYLNFIATKNNKKIMVYDRVAGNLEKTFGESALDQIKDTAKGISSTLAGMGLTVSTKSAISLLNTLGYLTEEQQAWLDTVNKYSTVWAKIEALKIAQETFEDNLSELQYNALTYVIRLLEYLHNQGILKD